MFHFGLVVVIVGIHFALAFPHILCHQIHAKDKLVLDEVLLIECVQIEEFVELIAILIVLRAILEVVLSGKGVLVAGPLTFSAEHLYFLGVILVLHQCFIAITSLCEKEMPAQSST